MLRNIPEYGEFPRLRHTSLSSLVGATGRLHTSRSLPYTLSHFQYGAEQRCPSGTGGVIKGGLLALLAMQGTQKLPYAPGRGLRGIGSSSKGLAKMKSPLRHFPRDKWDNTDSHGAWWHTAQKARCDRYALLDSSKNAQNKYGSKGTSSWPGEPPLT